MLFVIAVAAVGAKVVLQTDNSAFHGSSALQMFLKTSPDISTLCDGLMTETLSVWQCEIGKTCIYSNLTVVAWAAHKECPRGASRFEVHPPSKQFQILKSLWRADARVWECKFCGNMGQWLAQQHVEIEHVTLLMWRPHCIGLSKHYNQRHSKVQRFEWERSAAPDAMTAEIVTELGIMKHQLARYLSYTRHGQRVLVLNYASLIWDSHRIAANITAALNLSKPLRVNAAPEIRSSMNKVHEGVYEYGLNYDPMKCCSFNGHRCLNSRFNSALNKTIADELYDVETTLSALSM